MAIPEDIVAAVVADVSTRMADPNYAQVAVGSFVQQQPDVSRFLTAKTRRLEGGGEAVVHACFHSEVVSECLRRHRGTEELSRVGFDALDKASGDARMEALRQSEPAIAGYLDSNLEDASLQETVAHVALALVAAA